MGILQTTPVSRSSLMVRNTVALPTEGSSSLSASKVKVSCFCSRSLAIAFLGVVVLWPRFSSSAIRSGGLYTASCSDTTYRFKIVEWCPFIIENEI